MTTKFVHIQNPPHLKFLHIRVVFTSKILPHDKKNLHGQCPQRPRQIWSMPPLRIYGHSKIVSRVASVSEFIFIFVFKVKKLYGVRDECEWTVFLFSQTQFLACKVFQSYLYCKNCLQMTAESMFIGLTYHALFRMYPIAWFALIVLTHNCDFSNIYHLSFF